VTDEVLKRVGSVEQQVVETVNKLNDVRQQLKVLPQLVELLSDKARLAKVKMATAKPD
jgi:mannitol/fructose-specific phosphotransferase system IIA component (Ntr-type)